MEIPLTNINLFGHYKYLGMAPKLLFIIIIIIRFVMFIIIIVVVIHSFYIHFHSLNVSPSVFLYSLYLTHTVHLNT